MFTILAEFILLLKTSYRFSGLCVGHANAASVRLFDLGLRVRFANKLLWPMAWTAYLGFWIALGLSADAPLYWYLLIAISGLVGMVASARGWKLPKWADRPLSVALTGLSGAGLVAIIEVSNVGFASRYGAAGLFCWAAMSVPFLLLPSDWWETQKLRKTLISGGYFMAAASVSILISGQISVGFQVMAGLMVVLTVLALFLLITIGGAVLLWRVMQGTAADVLALTADSLGAIATHPRIARVGISAVAVVVSLPVLVLANAWLKRTLP